MKPARRRLLRLLGAAAALGGGLPLLAGCGRGRPPLRFGAPVWPGYELLFLARDSHLLDPALVRLVELPSASDSISALIAGSLEGAALTLDETLTARAEGVPLKVVAVVDVSAGGDALLARPGLGRLQDLKGCRIGVENSALGGLMLQGVLAAAHLGLSEIQVVPVTKDQHLRAYIERKLDAVITYEPNVSQLQARGATVLFDSRSLPDRIVDVLAVREEVLTTQPRAVTALVAAHFAGLGRFHRQPQAAAALISWRLGMPAERVLQAFRGLRLPDLAENRVWLGGKPSKLETLAADLVLQMSRAALLPPGQDVSGLAGPDFLGAS